MKVLTSEKSTSTDHQWLKCSMPSFPIPVSAAFHRVTGHFPDSSGRSSRATSLTSSDLFNPLGHSACCLIPTIQRSAFTADLFFGIQTLIAPDSSFRVGLPSSRCDGSRSPLLLLPRDRCHALALCRSVSCCPDELGWRTGAGHCQPREPLSTGRIEAASRHTSVASLCGMSAVGT
jgi:hypothetical protein